MKSSENLGPLVFNTVIRKNIRLAEAPGMRRSIFRSASRSFGANDYTNLAVEIVERCGMKIPETAPVQDVQEVITEETENIGS
jgi:cellulose biosynthesis protein BcsQ